MCEKIGGMCAAAPPPLGLIEPGDGAFRFTGEDLTLYPPLLTQGCCWASI